MAQIIVYHYYTSCSKLMANTMELTCFQHCDWVY